MAKVYDIYDMAHIASYKKAKAFSEPDLDHPEKFTNISSHHMLIRYNKEGKARIWEDFNPSRHPSLGAAQNSELCMLPHDNTNQVWAQHGCKLSIAGEGPRSEERRVGKEC